MIHTTRNSLLHRISPVARRVQSLSVWSGVEMAPPDPILGLTDAFKKDTFADKINVGVGAYRTDEGQPLVLSSVREASKRVLEMNHEYAPIAGVPEFVSEATQFVYGPDSDVLAENRVAAVQALSGTGALRLTGEFIAKWMKPADGGLAIYIPNPTWGNHVGVYKASGFDVRRYRYLDPATSRLDMGGLLTDISEAPEGSVILLHACAHNPTGVDPTKTEWAQIAEVTKSRNHLVIMDSAYQGFATGNPDDDAWSIRHFAETGHTMMVCQSMAKNFGLYGERVGCLSMVAQNEEEAARVLSQMKIVIRTMYSSPPLYGARIVAEILKDPELKSMWFSECAAMAQRIIDMRKLLTQELVAAESARDWSHIEEQIGMFCFTGLTKDEVKRMIEEYHVYMTGDGRISMSGVNTGNVKRLAAAIHAVTK